MTMVGVIGGGQLGRMLALAGGPLDVRCRFLTVGDAAASAALGEQMPLEDDASLRRFASGLRVATYEFENVPVATAAALERLVPVFPPPAALAVTQDRLAEKEFLGTLGLATTSFAAVDSMGDVPSACRRVGLPALMKLRQSGYDGRGQVVVHTESEAQQAWLHLGSRAAVLERFVKFTRELSLIAVAVRDGEPRFYPLVENRHVDGMLRVSLAPAPCASPALQAAAEAYASRVLTALDYVGVLTVEFFEVDGRLIGNELAPRVHNSGHWTIEGAETSQFENHLRAILGLPLGSTAAVGHSALVNLIGSAPDAAAILRVRDAHLHLYGKAPRPGRKLGHVTLRAQQAEQLEDRLRELGHVIERQAEDGTARATLKSPDGA